MQISVFYHHILQAQLKSGRPLMEMLRRVRSWGVEGVYPDLHTLLADFSGTMAQLKDADLVVSGICETFHWEQAFSADDAKKLIDTAVLCGTSNVFVVPGFLPKNDADILRDLNDAEEISAFMEENEAVQAMKQALQYTVAYADERGVAVSLEDYDGWTAPYSKLAELQ